MTDMDRADADAPDTVETDPAAPEGPEGEVIKGEPGGDADAGAVTVGRAAAMYFSASSKKLSQQQRVAVTRFVAWAGSDRELASLSAHQMSLFQEAQGANVADLGNRLLPVKAFLSYAKKKDWMEANLSVHLRVKRPARGSAGANGVTKAGDEDVVEMTVEGLELARNELERLRNERPAIARKLEEAMADKDFRENAPLDAARDEQALLEARIRDLEHQVAHARVNSASPQANDGRVHLGSSVSATNLVSNKTVEYTLVGQNEVDAAAGRISIASPVGRALVGAAAGDEVEVEAPSGTIRFLVGEVSG
jgi:transcription elongation factor GreA